MGSSLVTAAIAASVAILMSLVWLYRSWTGPLSHLPGTTLSKFSGIATTLRQRTGTRVHYLADLHAKYGPLVRVSPTEVSVAGMESTNEVHKITGGFLKTDFYTKFTVSSESTVFSAVDPNVHQKWRRLLAPTMSESSIKTLQSTVQDKTGLFISQLKNEHMRQGYVDVAKWLYFYATDVIGDMAFGEGFNMLARGETNQYMQDLQDLGKLNFRRLAITNCSMDQLPNIPILGFRKLHQLRARLDIYAAQSLDRFRARVAAYPNVKSQMFFSNLLGEKGTAAGLTTGQIGHQAKGFLVAGTDTTANTLAFLIYKVAATPAVRAKLVAALAGLPEHPTNDELKTVEYLNWVIEETLRLYGAAPAPLPRRVPAGGRTLDGYHVPAGLTVSPCAYVLHRDPNIFPDPHAWTPERWAAPTDDMRHAFHAWGGGSRSCIGINLARAELRMATAAFFIAFPAATPAYGVDGFSDDDMEIFEAFVIKPRGSRCLIK